MRTDQVGIVVGQVLLLEASVRLTQLMLVLFSRSPPDATASSREMDRSWPRIPCRYGGLFLPGYE